VKEDNTTMRNTELTEKEALIVTMRRELDEWVKYSNSFGRCVEQCEFQHCETVGEWIEGLADWVTELEQGLTPYQEEMWEQFADMRQQFREELVED
jgi:hypothetical protein